MSSLSRSFKTAIVAALTAGTMLTSIAPSFAAENRDRGTQDRRDNDRRGENRRDDNAQRGGNQQNAVPQNTAQRDGRPGTEQWRRDNDRRDNDRRDWNRGNDRNDRRFDGRNWNGGDRRWGGGTRVVVVQRPPRYKRVIVRPTRYYRDVRVVRHYGNRYPGFGFHYRDDDALRFLGLTALGLVIFNQLNEAQQRAHEAAMIDATSVPIGERITWNDGRYSGIVTPVRDGTSMSGLYCREFQQEVMIGSRREEAYGTACQQPDGSWQIVDS